MSVDLYIVPSGYRSWGDAEWDAFFERGPENDELGRHRFVGRALAAVAHNLEGGRPGSGFPLVMRMETDEREPVGWDATEIASLLAEIERVRPALAALPVNGSTLQADDDEVARLVAEFEKYHGGRHPAHLEDFYRLFFDVMERTARRALQTGQGLAVIA